jgi:hypothetical protein
MYFRRKSRTATALAQCEEYTMMPQNVRDAGADPCIPSVPRYSSWMDNTNEGSTEE